MNQTLLSDLQYGQPELLFQRESHWSWQFSEDPSGIQSQQDQHKILPDPIAGSAAWGEGR